MIPLLVCLVVLLSEGDVSNSILPGVTPNAINFLLGQHHEGIGTCPQPILQLLAVCPHPLEGTSGWYIAIMSDGIPFTSVLVQWQNCLHPTCLIKVSSWKLMVNSRGRIVRIDACTRVASLQATIGTPVQAVWLNTAK